MSVWHLEIVFYRHTEPDAQRVTRSTCLSSESPVLAMYDLKRNILRVHGDIYIVAEKRRWLGEPTDIPLYTKRGYVSAKGDGK